MNKGSLVQSAVKGASKKKVSTTIYLPADLKKKVKAKFNMSMLAEAAFRQALLEQAILEPSDETPAPTSTDWHDVVPCGAVVDDIIDNGTEVTGAIVMAEGKENAIWDLEGNLKAASFEITPISNAAFQLRRKTIKEQLEKSAKQPAAS